MQDKNWPETLISGGTKNWGATEARHFLGLCRNRVQDKSDVKARFRANISMVSLFRGISSFSNVFFFIKLVGKLF
ncbi:hypothetical protein EH204_02145 [Pectobacterium carotovorum subsp. carotovorum]|nr:hypothetical protein EH204_02145 [Pectobacterium carotovorum subsp. carotovorum]